MAKYMLCNTDKGLIPDPLQSKRFNRHIKRGAWFEADVKHQRNAAFHRKFFAMMGLAFKNWEPVNQHAAKIMGQDVKKSFERFRKDVIILAGFYTQTFGLDGEIKLEAQSISFGNMEQPEFESVYSSCAQVLLDIVFKKRISRAELDRQVEELLRF